MRPTRRLPVLLAVVLAIFATACYPPVPPGDDFSVRWARVLTGPTDEDELDGVGAASDGSVYVTGKFEGAATFAGVPLASAGAADIPFARFDAFGRTLWVQRFGGPGEDNLFDVDATSAGPVGTGWFAGTVAFGGVTLTSAGPSDCVVVALRPDGTTRWARAFGGPGRDGCNEVTVSRDGSVTTSIDTQGGWTPLGGSPLPRVPVSDTVLLRLAPDGSPVWMRAVGGAGPQRGKSLAVAPDGSVSFGGDSIGALTVADRTVAVPTAGSRDAWLSRWSPAGVLQWIETWGGPGDDLAKGVVDDGTHVTYGGPFTGSITVGGTTLDAGAAPDVLLAQRRASGAVRWATSVQATAELGGVELIGAPDGGILFSGPAWPGIRFGSATGPGIDLDGRDGGVTWLARYRPDGTPAFARTIPGTAWGRVASLPASGAASTST